MFGRQSAAGARQSVLDTVKAASQPAQPADDAAPGGAAEHYDTHTFTGARR